MIKYYINTSTFHRVGHFPNKPNQIAVELQRDGTEHPQTREEYDDPKTALRMFRKNWKNYGKTKWSINEIFVEYAYLEAVNTDTDYYFGWSFGWLDWAIQEPEKEEAEPEKLPTYSEIKKNPKYKLHHPSWGKGYVSRKLTEAEFPVEPYKGRFGKGYKVKKPNWNSTTYCIIEYWVEK